MGEREELSAGRRSSSADSDCLRLIANRDQMPYLPKFFFADPANQQKMFGFAKRAELRPVGNYGRRCFCADVRQFFQLGGSRRIDVDGRFRD